MLLEAALDKADSWVVSGSLCGWGDPFLSRFELVVFLLVPTDVRLTRLRAREVMRYGHEAICPGGVLHKAHVDFLEWAQQYDTGGLNMRSRALHEQWILKLPRAVLRLDGNRPLETLLSEVQASMPSDSVDLNESPSRLRDDFYSRAAAIGGSGNF